MNVTPLATHGVILLEPSYSVLANGVLKQAGIALTPWQDALINFMNDHLLLLN